MSVDKIVTRACHAHVFGNVVQAHGEDYLLCFDGASPLRAVLSATSPDELSPRLIQRIHFILHPNKESAAFLTLLRETIDEEYNQSKNGERQNTHNTEVAVSFLLDGEIVESNASKALTIAIDGNNYRKLRRHPALAGLRIEATPQAPVDFRPQWEKRRSY